MAFDETINECLENINKLQAEIQRNLDLLYTAKRSKFMQDKVVVEYSELIERIQHYKFYLKFGNDRLKYWDIPTEKDTSQLKDGFYESRWACHHTIKNMRLFLVKDRPILVTKSDYEKYFKANLE